MWYETLPSGVWKSFFSNPSRSQNTRYSNGSNIASDTALTSGSSGNSNGISCLNRRVHVLQAEHRLDVAQLELGHAATGFLPDQQMRYLVVLENADQIEPNARLVVVDVAGREQRYLAGRALTVSRRPGDALRRDAAK